MSRSEAQRAADKRYAKKTQDRYSNFVVHFLPAEYESICATIKDAGLSKADFIRWAAEKLKNEK